MTVLKTYGQIGVQTLKQAVTPYDATGKTVQSIRFVVDGDKLLFIAREFFTLLEKGIRPSVKKPSKEMIDSFTEYAKARGFTDPEKAAWAIAVNQLKVGDATHRAGGRVVYSGVMDTFTKNLSEELKKDFSKELVMGVKESFK